MLRPKMKIIPLASKMKPKIKMSLSGSICRTPNNQKQIPAKMSKTPNIFINIDFLKYRKFKKICDAPVAQLD